jgi:cytochrome P450
VNKISFWNSEGDSGHSPLHTICSLTGQVRGANPEKDLIYALALAEQAGDHLSEDELLAMIVLLLVAGHETTVNLIGNGVLALLENPDQLDRLLCQCQCVNQVLLWVSAAI